MKKNKQNYTAEEAIILAVKAGYKIDIKKSYIETLADPKFWLFLGNSIGWTDRKACIVHGEVKKVMDKFFCSGADFRCVTKDFIDFYSFQQHQYINCLQKGGSTEDFFAELK